MGTFVPQQHCAVLKTLATHAAGIRSFPGRRHARCCEHDVCLSQSITCSFKAWKVAKGKGFGLENCSSDSWFLLSRAYVLAVQKAGYSWAHYCDPCREVTRVQHWLQQLWLRSWEAGIFQPMLLGAHLLLGQCFPRNLPKESNSNTQQVCTYKRQMK